MNLCRCAVCGNVVPYSVLKKYAERCADNVELDRQTRSGTSHFCLQKLRCSPTGILASFCAAKSLRSLRIYVLLWDRIAVQIVLLRYFFCLISYFYMLLILQSAPSRLSPNEALPHTPLGALPLDPTSPPAPSLSVRFISRFARCLGAALLIPHS